MKFYKLVITLLVLFLFTGCSLKADTNQEEIVEVQDELIELALIEYEKPYVPDTKMVKVAIRELGNEGGEKFWSWYGFETHAAWCACFVSWCANQCGYIEEGVIPKFALCQDGVDYFKSNGLWLPGWSTPEEGMLIFFDYSENRSYANHVGIVEKVEGNTIYVIDGNSKDMVRENPYIIGQADIMGYATPQY